MTPRQFFKKIIEAGFYLIFFATPFILTTVNFELFEFPKMLFVYALTAVVTGSWLGLSLVKGKLMIRHSWLVWPLLLFLASQIVSTLISIHPFTSVWGYYSRFHGGLVSTICYALLFIIFTSTASKRQVKTSLILLLSAATFISLYGMAEHFGIDAKYWIQDVQSRVFSTLGQPNWLAAWLGALAPLTWYFYLRPPRSFWPSALFLAQLVLAIAYGLTALLLQTPLPTTTGGVVLLLVLFAPGLYGAYLLSKNYQPAWLKSLALLELAGLLVATILFTKSRSGILALGASYAFFWTLTLLHSSALGGRRGGSPAPRPQSRRKSDEDGRWGKHLTGPSIFKFLLLTSYFLLLVFLIGSEWTPNVWQMVKGKQPATGKADVQTSPSVNPQAEYFISKSTDIRKAVWEGGLNVWKNYPLFGSGVETFAYSYYNHRVRAHNDTSEWDFLYNKAHNEYLNFLATTGLVGTTAVFTLIAGYAIFSLGRFIGQRPWALGLLTIPLLLLFISPIREKLIIYPPILIPLGTSLGLAFSLAYFIKLATKPKLPRLTNLQIAFLSGFLSILITNFYGFSVVTVALLFFFYPAFSVVLYAKKRLWQWRFAQETDNWDKLSWLHWLGLITIFLVVGYWLLVTFQYWRADKTYNLGKNFVGNGNVLTGLQQLSQAIALRPKEAVYHMEIAEAAATAAYAYAGQEATSSAQTADQFLQLADQETKITLSLNPVHLNFYKTTTKIYIVLAQIKPDHYLPLAIRTLEVAEQLSPTDPKITLNLALLYDQAGQEELAGKYFEKTVELKPDYRQGWIYLAEFYQNRGNIDQAQKAYQYILDNIYYQDAGVLKALKKLNQEK